MSQRYVVTCMQYSVLAVHSRSGRKVDNWELYPSTLQEIGRVCRPSIARAILLTHDNKALSRVSIYMEWKLLL